MSGARSKRDARRNYKAHLLDLASGYVYDLDPAEDDPDDADTQQLTVDERRAIRDTVADEIFRRAVRNSGEPYSPEADT